jgi:hypothetical protein
MSFAFHPIFKSPSRTTFAANLMAKSFVDIRLDEHQNNFRAEAGNSSYINSVISQSAPRGIREIHRCRSIIRSFHTDCQGQAPLPPSPPTGRIEGTIYRSGSNEPLRGARVTLTRINASTGSPINAVGGGIATSINSPGNPTSIPAISFSNSGARPAPSGQPTPPEPLPIPPVLTDSQGHFALTELESGPYRISIASNGYVRQEYGQRVFPGQGTLLNLADGQTIRDLVVHLTQTGTISGRITDTNGQLAVGVPVRLLKLAYNAIGQKTFQDGGTTSTNDRGEYRIFWVTPGRYFVAAGVPPGPAPTGTSGPNDPLDRYSITFFPGVSDSTRASMIEVQSGGEAAADFSVPQLQLFHVRGKVTDSTGGPPTAISVSFAYQTITGQIGSFSIGQSYNATTGNFDVPNLTPGTYIVQVATTTVERTTIDVVNANVENLSFAMGTGAVLSGHIRVDGPGNSLSPGAERARLQLRGINVGLTVSHNNVEQDGSFKIESISPADYRAVVTSLPPELYVKEVRLGGLDLMNQTIHVISGTPISGTVDVLLSPNVSQIDGSVLDDRGQPISGIMAVLVPDRNRDHTGLFKTATTDQTGHYSIRGIPPSDYKLFAWETLESFGYFDPELLKQSDSQGKAIHISESSKLNQDIRSIRPAQ